MSFFVPVAAAVWQAEGAASANDSIYLWIALITGVIGLLAAVLFARGVLSSDTGTPEMQRISNAIREGAGECESNRERGTGVDGRRAARGQDRDGACP